ncbi:hypothetical protein Tco_1161720 [Tanacetum coccineum]
MHPASHRSLYCQMSNLQQSGSSHQELQKLRTSLGKQPAISICNLSCLWGERALEWIFKKRTKNKAKMTKPNSEWKRL